MLFYDAFYFHGNQKKYSIFKDEFYTQPISKSSGQKKNAIQFSYN
jgi:hypothetical protein